MIYLAVVFVGISLLLYVLLGGADFGAGIIEIVTGKKGINTISKAIAPVWEANHIWLIVIIVVLFNAFPAVYSTVTSYLHIPLMLILLGIIFRGTAFTFRYYDPFQDKSHRVYTFVFKLFSVLTPFFLGLALGAVILGRMTLSPDATFYELYVAPWLNFFSLTLGVFVVLLFSFLAAVYLSGEPASDEDRESYRRYAKRLLLALVAVGALVFGAAELAGLSLVKLYASSWMSLACAILATLFLPAFFYAIHKKNTLLSRLIAGALTVFILLGWFGAQFPVLVVLQDSESLTIYNTVASDSTLLMMIVALFGGLAIVIPLLVYLFRVYKFSEEPGI